MLVQVAVCYDDSRSVSTPCQALVILHELVSFIDSKELNTQTGTWNKIKKNYCYENCIFSPYLIATHPMTRADFYIATIGVAHAVYAIAGLEPTDLLEKNAR